MIKQRVRSLIRVQKKMSIARGDIFDVKYARGGQMVRQERSLSIPLLFIEPTFDHSIALSVTPRVRMLLKREWVEPCGCKYEL